MQINNDDVREEALTPEIQLIPQSSIEIKNRIFRGSHLEITPDTS